MQNHPLTTLTAGATVASAVGINQNKKENERYNKESQAETERHNAVMEENTERFNSAILLQNERNYLASRYDNIRDPKEKMRIGERLNECEDSLNRLRIDNVNFHSSTKVDSSLNSGGSDVPEM